MNSCIYAGKVTHHRRMPVENRFDFNLYMMLLDLDELDVVFRKRWFWSSRGPNLVWFRERDHLKEFAHHDASLREKLVLLLHQRGFDRPLGPIRLLTGVRHAFFLMNPVCFYYCYSPEGDRLEAIVVEVNNTPWGEQHIYAIEIETDSGPSPGPKRATTGSQEQFESSGTVRAKRIAKEFHVSPFMSMEMQYEMAFTIPGNRLGVQISNTGREGRMLQVAMKLERIELTASSLSRCLLGYPLLSLKVFAGIYWQALKLYWKRSPFFKHPRASFQTSGMHRASLDLEPASRQADTQAELIQS